MTIQDMKCILTIAEEGSINKAARKLFIAQPSLSKCVKKIEKEYGISLFQRSTGTALKITQEGECFLRMAQEVMQRHQLFENQLRWMRDQQDDKIVLGMTPRNSYSVASPLLQWLLHNHANFFIALQVESTPQMKSDLHDGRLNMAVFDVLEQEVEPGLHYQPIYPSLIWVYLRKGSPAGEKARKIPGIEWPVLRMKDLQGETLAVNVPGSSSRWKAETLMKKNLVSCKLMELPDFTNRIMMVEAGKASLLTNLYTSMEQNIDQDRLFLIHPEENILSVMALVCRQNFQTDPRFRAVLEGIRLCFPETRPTWYRAFLQEQLAKKLAGIKHAQHPGSPFQQHRGSQQSTSRNQPPSTLCSTHDLRSLFLRIPISTILQP